MSEIGLGDIVRTKSDHRTATVIMIERDAEVAHLSFHTGGREPRYFEPRYFADLEVVAKAVQQAARKPGEVVTAVLVEITHDVNDEWWEALGIDRDTFYNAGDDGTFVDVKYENTRPD